MQPLPIIDALSSEQPESARVRALATLGRLFSYPDEHYAARVELLYVIMQGRDAAAARGLSEFGQFVESCTPYDLEEAYTRTFDVNPTCALEVGWHLFGEDYIRGQFLVRMRQELARYEIEESTELPDHLAHVLAVVSAMPDDEARRFAQGCLFPALHKMQAALDRASSPFRHLVRSLIVLLEADFGASEPWGENEERLLRNAHEFPGQNGPRPPGMSDPLRSYAPPDARDAPVALVPLQLRYAAPSRPLDQSCGSAQESPT